MYALVLGGGGDASLGFPPTRKDAVGENRRVRQETLDPARPKRGRASPAPSEPPVAIYHLHVKNISRRDGRSAVAAAAYRAGETLPNEAEEKDSAFAGKRDVVFTEIRLPPNAPAWLPDPAKLWNPVEAPEKRKDPPRATQ